MPRTEDLILVSVDDHIVEPPNLFDNASPRLRELAPKFVHKDDGTDVWQYEGSEMPNVGLNAVAGKKPEEYGIEPTALADIRRGCWDVAERVQDMNRNGVLASMNFPSFVGFLTPLSYGGAASIALVALITNHRKNGFWSFAAGEGWEYTGTLTAACIAIATFGPGKWSIDHALDLKFPFEADKALLVAAALGLLGTAVFLAIFWRPPAKTEG